MGTNSVIYKVIQLKKRDMILLLTTYLASHLIIMEVHECPCILLDFPSVDKYFGEAQAVADVSRAASPLPAFLLIVIPLLLPVAAALAQVALAARCCDSVGHPCRCNGVGERCFPTAWRKEKRSLLRNTGMR